MTWSYKYPKEGQTFACPKCEEPMRRQPSWDIWHCIPCQFSLDTWYDPQAKIINVETEPYDSQTNLIIKRINHSKIKKWLNNLFKEELFLCPCPQCVLHRRRRVELSKEDNLK